VPEFEFGTSVSDDLTLRRDVLVHLDSGIHHSSDLFTCIFELIKLALNSVVLGGVVASVLDIGPNVSWFSPGR
jgi:hypothetical protein